MVLKVEISEIFHQIKIFCYTARKVRAMLPRGVKKNKDVESYRVSHNIVYTFGLLVSGPPKHLEVPSWTFFNSPFYVDFRTIQFVMIW